jgi:hypothetical protein
LTILGEGGVKVLLGSWISPHVHQARLLSGQKKVETFAQVQKTKNSVGDLEKTGNLTRPERGIWQARMGQMFCELQSIKKLNAMHQEHLCDRIVLSKTTKCQQIKKTEGQG